MELINQNKGENSFKRIPAWIDYTKAESRFATCSTGSNTIEYNLLVYFYFILIFFTLDFVEEIKASSINFYYIYLYEMHEQYRST